MEIIVKLTCCRSSRPLLVWIRVYAHGSFSKMAKHAHCANVKERNSEKIVRKNLEPLVAKNNSISNYYRVVRVEPSPSLRAHGGIRTADVIAVTDGEPMCGGGGGGGGRSCVTGIYKLFDRTTEAAATAAAATTTTAFDGK